MLDKQIEKLESNIEYANGYIFESIKNQDECIDDVRESGRRTRDRLRRCIEQYQEELYALKILKLCHTGR
jgi:hypothetical protein